MFGQDDLPLDENVVELDVDLEKIHICLDGNNVKNSNRDLHGFKFFPIGKSEIALSSRCGSSNEVAYDLTGKRLIGFKTVISDNNWKQRNVRTICPIIDEPDCTETTFFHNLP